MMESSFTFCLLGGDYDGEVVELDFRLDLDGGVEILEARFADLPKPFPEEMYTQELFDYVEVLVRERGQ